MQLVIDSNQLEDETLRRFLVASKANRAVITDYVSMEAYKGNTLAKIYKSMSILADFPDQVLVLKGTRAAATRKGRLAGLQKRLIDYDQTSTFARYVQDLRKAQAGDLHIQQQLLDHGKEADRHLGLMLADATTMWKAIETVASQHSKDELRAVQVGKPYPPAFYEKVMRNVLQMAGRMFKSHPDAPPIPRIPDVPNTFIFRVALCGYLWAVNWAATGGAQGAKPERLRNDMVDTTLAAYATYFDGLMTRDRKALDLHQTARVWLCAIFSCQLPGGWLPRPDMAGFNAA